MSVATPPGRIRSADEIIADKNEWITVPADMNGPRTAIVFKNMDAAAAQDATNDLNIVAPMLDRPRPVRMNGDRFISSPISDECTRPGNRPLGVIGSDQVIIVHNDVLSEMIRRAAEFKTARDAARMAAAEAAAAAQARAEAATAAAKAAQVAQPEKLQRDISPTSSAPAAQTKLMLEKTKADSPREKPAKVRVAKPRPVRVPPSRPEPKFAPLVLVKLKPPYSTNIIASKSRELWKRDAKEDNLLVIDLQAVLPEPDKAPQVASDMMRALGFAAHRLRENDKEASDPVELEGHVIKVQNRVLEKARALLQLHAR